MDNSECDLTYYFTKSNPNFMSQAGFYIGKYVKRKNSQQLLDDFLFVFRNYLSFYKTYERRIDEDDFTRYMYISIWKDKVRFFWDNYEMPKFFLHRDMTTLLIRKPKQIFYTYTREYHEGESRKEVLKEVFERFEKETWKERDG